MCPDRYNKKAGLHYCCSAHQALVLPSNQNNNTEAHAVCTNARNMRVH